MKYHIFVALLLSAVLAIPGFSQQTNSNGGTQQAAPAQSTVSSRPPLKLETKTDFWDGDDPNLGNLITHPFASKKYVQRLVTPIRDRVNELEQLNSENGTAIKDTDSRAQQGLQLVSAKTSTADQHATDATTKAQSAQLAATDASTRVSTAEKMVGSLDQYKGGAQTEIRFRPGQTVLSKDAKDALDQMATPLKDQRSYLIEVRGFSSGSGQAAIAASQKIADSVARYLVLNHQIPMYRISTLAMGNAAATGEAATARHTSGGRVEVNLLKNDLASAQH
jgi:outer membrane protein OmpA-like peptidoglycan-associated protein